MSERPPAPPDDDEVIRPGIDSIYGPGTGVPASRTPGGYPPGSPAARPPTAIRVPGETPYVTYTLIALTIFVFLLQNLQGMFRIQIPFILDPKDNVRIMQGEYWRFITPIFLHGGLLHIGFNMYALGVIGPGLERHFKHARFLALYLVSGFAGNVLSFIFTPNPSVGASTAIFGLIAAQGVFIYQNRELFQGMVGPALRQVITIAVINLILGLSPGIDNWGHIGGMLGGLAFTFLGGPLLEIDRYAYPPSVEDRRTPASVIVAVLAVTVVFAALAFWVILQRG